MRVLLFLAAVLAFAYNVQAANWALIVAGSNDYSNYRHQSDACHAYQVAKKFGIPEKQIILMAFDDIASSSLNPFPGKIFNAPSAKGVAGVDVYAGCKISYSGNLVTAANFLAVLQGDASKVPAGYPVLNTTADDDIFVYYTDHGGVGIVAMPVGDYLYATDLNNALQAMYKAKKYNKLVFYLEACESGSMFEGILPSNIEVYATTASSADESSYGTYCPPDDMVNGKELNSCLGDEYSVNWMENSDAKGQTETLDAQTTYVTQATKMSGVHVYGDQSWTSLRIGEFQGNLSHSTVGSASVYHSSPRMSSHSMIDSRDIKLRLAYAAYVRAMEQKASASQVAEKYAALEAEILARSAADNFFQRFSTAVQADGSLMAPSKLPVSGTACQKAVDAAIAECGMWTDYSLKYHNVVVNACMQPHACDATTEALVETVRSLCKN